MISWLRARSDLEFALQFRKAVAELWRLEAPAEHELASEHIPIARDRQAAVQHLASKDSDYQKTRADVARGVLRATDIALRNGVPIRLTSYPAPAIGGPVIPLNLFDVILHDTSHGGVDRQWIVDALNQTVGQAEERVRQEFRKMINPVHWVKELLRFVVRIPFILVETSGFDVSKVEDHFLGRLFKLAEIALIIYVLLKLGVGRDELRSVLTNILAK